MEAVARTVGDWLAASGLNAATAARRAGVSPSTVHRILNGYVDPAVGTLREIGIACGIDVDLATRPLSDPQAAAAARAILEGADEPPPGSGISAWRERLLRIAGSDNPVEVVKAGANASSPLRRPGAVLYSGQIALGRVASAGDASKGRWAVSGAAGLYLPPASSPVPPVTILWCESVRTVVHLLADTDLRETHRRDRAALAVVAADAELFRGSFVDGIVRYAAPVQIVLDCLAQTGPVADDALEEAMSW